MPWKLPRPRYGLRTLLVVMLASGIGLAIWTSPGRWRTYRNQQARQRIDPYELSIAGDGNPAERPTRARRHPRRQPAHALGLRQDPCVS